MTKETEPNQSSLALHYRANLQYIGSRVSEYQKMCQSAARYGKTHKGVQSGIPQQTNGDVQALIHQTLVIENPQGDFSYCLMADPLITTEGPTFPDKIFMDIGYIHGLISLDYGILKPSQKFTKPHSEYACTTPVFYKYASSETAPWKESLGVIGHNGYHEVEGDEIPLTEYSRLENYFLSLALVAGLPGFKGSPSQLVFDPEHFEHYSPLDLFLQLEDRQYNTC